MNTTAKQLQGNMFTLAYFPKPLSFRKARMACVSRQSDLVSPVDAGVIGSIAETVNENYTESLILSH